MFAPFLLSMLFIQGPGALQPGAGIVRGFLQSAAGGPAAGVRVAAVPADDPTSSAFLSVAETDPAGRYTLMNIPAGRYYIVAGRVKNLTYYPGGAEAAKAAEIVVEAAQVRSNVNFIVPVDSKRPIVPPHPSYAEYRAFQTIQVETNPDKKLNLLLGFENAYPRSMQLPAVYTSLMEIYIANHNESKAAEYGAKVLKQDPQNVQALVLMSRKFAILQNDYSSALQYAERAVTAVTRMKNQPPPNSDPAYQAWVVALEANARGNLEWLHTSQTKQEKALLSAVTRRR